MLAVLNRRPGPLSRPTLIVCFGTPAILFIIAIVAFGLLCMGRISSQQYFAVQQYAVISGGIIFLGLCFTELGVNTITEVMRTRRELAVLSLILFLAFFSLALPKIFGFV